jgi:hypothetical protein
VNDLRDYDEEEDIIDKYKNFKNTSFYKYRKIDE